MDAIPLRLPFLMDGATGTALREQGMPPEACTEQWVLAHPEILVELQKRYVEAGSDVILAPTFGANGPRLARFGLEDKVEEYNAALVALSRRASGGKALVAGNLSPVGPLLDEEEPDRLERLIEIFARQGRALEEAGVDLFVVETMTDIAEARAAVIALREVSSRPVMVCFTVDGDGETADGADILAACVIMEGLGAAAFGINCSEGPKMVLEGLRRLTPYAAVPLVAKPNAGLPAEEGNDPACYLSPEEFAACVPDLARAGARIFGGCCGTGPEHIAALRKAVDAMDLSAPAGFPRDEDSILCASRTEVHFISPTVDVGETIECSPHLEEDILEAEDAPSGAVKIAVYSQDDLDVFNEAQYMIREALCLLSDSPEILEKALRLYNGRAFYDGTGAIEADVLERLKDKYGLIVL
ncbi:homocysteine S-methyltransferase family protein [Papillibacter cinnamivorans]|uniref:5-methyltetrahydrofolate--homocysteine methyltransferase n=1 Tax=Papillibacter cinnamivorans DSM 12816 TaxID=1122930 RepID=A0A1W1ZZS2_9FIRM|nr:homocysteine S-methyltransferase family protein [Papillibacter cinnamivorans]SMC53890.1 5-methyltetrahydrofolate--homocysteine methyltransferase [Papillibacter cinnamivorans DSM 12816]